MTDITTIALERNDGRSETLAAYRGKVLLVVNVASECGFTPQYEGLEQLYRDKRAEGFEILAFPANDFGGQEPGSNADIARFCQSKYNVDFPLFAKISALKPDRHPLYDALTAAQPAAIGEGPLRARMKGYGVERADPTEILWNFEKFLIGRDGRVVARFTSDVAPDDARLLDAIAKELAKPAP